MSDEPRHAWRDRPDRQAPGSSNDGALEYLLTELEILDREIEARFDHLNVVRRRAAVVRTVIGTVPPIELSTIVQALIRQVRTMEDGQCGERLRKDRITT